MVSWCAKHDLYEANERKDWPKHKQILEQAEEILGAIYGRDALNRYKTTINQGLLGRIDMHKALNRIDGFKPDLREDVLDIAGIWRGISLETNLCAKKETSIVAAAGRDVTTVALKNNLGDHPVIRGRVAMATILTDQIQAVAQDPNLSQERRQIEIEGLVRESYQSKSAALYLLQDRIAKGQVINPATKQPYKSVDDMFDQIYNKPGGKPGQPLEDAKAALGLFPQN